MGHRFIADLKPGERLEEAVFLIRSKDLRTTTQGGLYIHAVLVDRTGQLLARMWQATEAMFESMPEGGFLAFKGRTENYKGNLQFIIDSIRTADPESYDIGDYLAVTEKNIDGMWKRVVEILGDIRNEDLKELMQEFLADSELMSAFRRAPAAVVMHHAYIGGLLEHTLSVLEVALKVVPLYPELSMDLMLAGVFLHDLGKAKELSFGTSFAYTDEGQLVGHVVQAAIWVDRNTEAVSKRTGKEFPIELRNVLQHIILSHHGQYEFGAPKLPAIPEAAAIHYLDNLDAKVHMFLAEIKNARDPASNWTKYNQALATRIYKPDTMGVRGGEL